MAQRLQSLPPGAGLLALGATPFALGAVSAAVGLGAEGAPRLACPFAAATGLPCPFCGASRSFRFAASGDAAFLQFNPFWVFVAVAFMLAGAALLMLHVRRRRATQAGAPPPPPARLRPQWLPPVAIIGALILAGWAVGLAHRGVIVG